MKTLKDVRLRRQDTLKPCPFCGSRAVIIRIGYISDQTFKIKCNQYKELCDISPSTKKGTEEVVCKIWNKRY